YFGLEEAVTVVGACNGNATCETQCGETCTNCPGDCGACPCGNNICETGEPVSCPQDGIDPCGTSASETGETCTDCPAACGLCSCGNTTCDPGEDSTNCPQDCGGTPTCGNAMVEGSEQCDDGNTDNCDGCSANCTTESCGDGVVCTGLGEQC